MVSGVADRNGIEPQSSNTEGRARKIQKKNQQKTADKNDARANSKIDSQNAPEPVGAYPHARRQGDFLFLSGVGPRKRGTPEIPGIEFDSEGNVVSYDIETETKSVIENVKTILQDSGACLEDVVDVQVFLTNMKKDFSKFNQVYADVFGPIGATRTTVEVNALPTPIHVEFKVIAQLNQ
ncbi:MAG: RidA family protein [Bdellovibrionales bacterium]|nr:RidA family protein [Bdellovibrionales bacterium]